MKIALVSQEYPPETGHGGIATQTFVKANGLARRGHTVYVISHSVDSSRSENLRDEVNVIRIPGPDERLDVNSDAVRWLAYSQLVAEELTALDRRVGLDLVDFPDWGSEGYLYLLNRSSKKPRVVVHLHGPLVMFVNAIGWPERDSDLAVVGLHMESICLRLADVVFSSSECSARWCVDHYGLERAGMEIIHLGVDRTRFRPMDVPKEARPTVAFVGKMVRNKGAEVLVEAALRVVKAMPDLQVWLIGPEHEGLAASLMKRASDAGQPELIRFFGYRPADELPDLLSRSHVFAAPSFYEGGPGFTVLEAMACGLPVVVSDGSGLAEVVRHGDNGLLVPPEDTLGLAGALGQLLEDADLREKMAERALKTIELEADATDCIERIESLYTRVIQDDGVER